jgi:hypothetical protein
VQWHFALDTPQSEFTALLAQHGRFFGGVTRHEYIPNVGGDYNDSA